MIMADVLAASLLWHFRLPLVWLSTSYHMRSMLIASLQVLLFSCDDLRGHSSRQGVSVLLFVLDGRQDIGLYWVSMMSV